MAIKEFWDFSGLPAYASSVQAITFLRSDITVINNNTVTLLGPGSGATAGWLLGTGNTIAYPNPNYGNYNPSFGVPYQNISDFTTRRSFIGFRFQTSNNTAQGQVPLLFLKNTAGQQQNLVLTTQLALNTPQYIEVMIDRANTTVVVWLDGVQVSSTFFDFNAFVAADGLATLYFGPTINANVLNNWQMRDVYFIDDTQDATQCNRLGPVDINPAPLVSASAPNWTSSDSQTPLIDLTTVLGTTNATQIAPTIKEPPTMDPVVLGFSSANLVPSEKILAVRGDVSAQRSAGYIFSPVTTLKYNNQTVNGKPLTYPNGNAMVYNQNAFLMEQAPDGTAWSAAALAATAVTLTP